MHFKLPMFLLRVEITWIKSAFIGHSDFSGERVHIII